MKIFYKLLVVFLFFHSSILAQYTFQKRMGGSTGGNPHDICHDAQQTSDNGFVFAGSTNVFGPTAPAKANILVTRLDTCGNQVWAKAIGKTDSVEIAYDIEQTSDGGFILAGYVSDDINPDNDNALGVKLDANGNMQWARIYGGSKADYFLSVKQTADGGYVFFGRSTSFGDLLFPDFYVVKTNAAGLVQWTYQIGMNGKEEYGQSVLELSSGGYLLSGYTTATTSGMYDVLLVRLDMNGNILWNKIYGNAKHEYAYHIAETVDKGFIITGVGDNGNGATDSEDLMLLKTDSLGFVLWYKLFNGTISTDYGYHIQQTADTGFVIGGRIIRAQNPFFEDAMGVIKTDASGNLQWSKTYGGVFFLQSFSYIQETNDNGYFIAGSSANFGTGTNEFVGVKTNAQGDANGCHLLTHTLTLTNPHINIDTLVLNNASGSTVAPLTIFAETNPGNITGNACPKSFSASTSVDTAWTCAGDSVQLNAVGGVYYNWFPSQGLNNSSISNPVVTTTQTTTYYVIIKPYNCINDSVIDTVTVMVNLLPGISISGNDSICPGSSSVLTASGAGSYIWSPSAGLSNTFGGVITATPSLNTTYTIIGEDINGCKDTIPFTIALRNAPNGNAGPDDTICPGQSVLLTGSGGKTYLWSNGATTQSVNVGPFTNTSYSLIVSDGNCNDTDYVNIEVRSFPLVDAGNDISVSPGTSVNLFATGNGIFTWFPSDGLSCTSCANPIAMPLKTTKYYVLLTDMNGCTGIDSVVVTVDILCGEFFVPNVFSPNADGQNDVFKVISNCISDFALTIYDRWGEKVFETTDINTGWDGTFKGEEMDAAVFSYIINASLLNKEDVFKKGNVTLVR